MAHRGFYGMTESGKTSCAIAISKRFKERGVRRIILDPMNDPRWEVEPEFDWIGSDPILFDSLWRQNEQCALFVDEGGKTIGRYNDQMVEVVTSSRHRGHEAHIISQRPQQMDPIMREQMSEIYIFRSSPGVAKLFSDEFANREILKATELGRGEFILCRRFSPEGQPTAAKCKIDVASGKVSYSR